MQKIRHPRRLEQSTFKSRARCGWLIALSIMYSAYSSAAAAQQQPLVTAPATDTRSTFPEGDSSLKSECRIVTPVVLLSLSVRPKQSSVQGGAAEIDILNASIEDINGNVVEKLSVLRKKNGFALSTPSGSFQAELTPGSDYRTGIINISGANHKYSLYLAAPIGVMMLSNPDGSEDKRK